jgi:hypothetical protein
MQRNETLCLHPWLAYHGYLFGYDNLFVIDHGSDNRAVRDTLAMFEVLSVHVRRLPASADYTQKGVFVSETLAEADATGLYDLLLPLDCDEFVVMRDADGRPSCNKAGLLSYLSGLATENRCFLVSENFLNSLNSPDGFWPLPYQKVFFTGGHCGVVDHGSHRCVSDYAPALPTRVAYVHFHHKPYEMQRAMSREKLRPFVDVDDDAALAAFQGPGAHLLPHLLKTEAEYMAIMTGGSIRFPELGQLFDRLGIDPRFAEG